MRLIPELPSPDGASPENNSAPKAIVRVLYKNRFYYRTSEQGSTPANQNVKHGRRTLGALQ